MAVRQKSEFAGIEDFDDWYENRVVDIHTGALRTFAISKYAHNLWKKFEQFRTEHHGRVANYDKYELLADAEVVSKKPDLPNVSSGDIAGMVRRTARVVVQHTPNVEIVTTFDDDSAKGALADYVLRSKIIGDGNNSNEMQQNLFASVMTAFTLGFDAVCPILVQRADKSWCMEYDEIHYRDFFPEPGVKDVRKATEVFVRRYLTKGEVEQLVRQQASGWDVNALRTLLQSNPRPQQQESTAHQNKKHRTIPLGYEVVTWYSSSGDHFLTFDVAHKTLLRIEKNKDPLKRLPVHVLVLEKDSQQPLGKSQIALVYGRQEFQDLMLNGAMKLWYKNLNPTLLAYGTGINGVPNMSPGKYVNIPNPNAKIEAFETNTQTLLQFGAITQQNLGAMVNLVGAADQQMAASAGNGMSATPQGVDAQEALVDITTNNYQKAVEYFFSRYCSYALTVYFQEMKGAGRIIPSAEARASMLSKGVDAGAFNEKGELLVDLQEMAVEYNVRCVPGSLVEMEDEKQLRILREIFVPLSQAMPALAATNNPEMLANAASAMQYIIRKTIELSGSNHAKEISTVFDQGVTPQLTAYQERVDALEESMGGLAASITDSNTVAIDAVKQMQEQMSTLTQMNALLLEKLGVTSGASASEMPANQTQPAAVLSQ